MTNLEASMIVISIRHYMYGGELWTDAEFEAMDMAVEKLQEPERKTGKWVEITDHETPIVCKCTECGWLTTHYDSFSFCPNCGADMRGEEHETD